MEFLKKKPGMPCGEFLGGAAAGEFLNFISVANSVEPAGRRSIESNGRNIAHRIALFPMLGVIACWAKRLQVFQLKRQMWVRLAR